MRFSRQFNITHTKADEWYDPHLVVDTPLFIDPYQLLRASGIWKGAHDELIDHFVYCYELVAEFTVTKEQALIDAALSLLSFPEVDELCLGYTSGGTQGVGSGKGYANAIIMAMKKNLKQTSSRPQAIEEYAILAHGIGGDRISDAAVNILKPRFIRFTQEVCSVHGVPMDLHVVKNAEVNLSAATWFGKEYSLPTNPHSGRPIILVPDRFLTTVNVISWAAWRRDATNKELRDHIDLHVGLKASKSEKIRAVLENPEHFTKWVRKTQAIEGLPGYDFATDPKGVVQWDKEPQTYAANNPLYLKRVNSHDELVLLMDETISRFQHYIEEENGWQLLRNKNGQPKSQEAARLILLGLALHYFEHYKIHLDNLDALGRKVVKLVSPNQVKAPFLVLVKNSSNYSLISRLEVQLMKFSITHPKGNARIIIIQNRDTEAVNTTLDAIPASLQKWREEFGLNVELAIINTLPPLPSTK